MDVKSVKDAHHFSLMVRLYQSYITEKALTCWLSNILLKLKRPLNSFVALLDSDSLSIASNSH